MLREVGQLNAADAAWERGYELYQELAKKRPQSHDYQNSLGYHEIVGGNLRMAENRAPDAIPPLESAQATFTALVAGNPSVPMFRTNLTEAQLALVWALNTAGRKADALQLSNRAIENARQA